MGTVLSALAGIGSSARMLLTPILDFAKAYERAAFSPGSPVSIPTTPYWTRDPPYPDLVKHQSAELPREVDVAIIGSGISGAAVAHSLLHSSKGSSVEKMVVLEARDICSGATARNGVYPRLAKHVGKDRAIALTRFQRKHLDLLLELCNTTGIDAAEAREVETVDLFLDSASFADAVKGVKETEPMLPEEEMKIWEREEAQKKFGTGPSVYGAVSYRAGALWPYRFVTTIWHRLLTQYHDILAIETHTPVESISTEDPEAPRGYPYALRTTRGTVYARNVVHATNGFASHLVPGLRRKITPAKAHMSAQKPGNLFPEQHGPHRSWSVIYGDGFDYVTQRPPEHGESRQSQGDLMLGGGFVCTLNRGIDMLAVSDDGAPLDGMTLAHISGVLPAAFSPNWGVGGGLRQAWSGILGFTRDMLPLVGRLDKTVTGRAPSDVNGGEWIVAGFAGEGMVWSWLSGMALGIIVSGRENSDLDAAPGRPAGRLADWFPHELYASKDRMKSADLSNLPSHL
ncbi:FAD dependent oxidoreductase-domain-containing protein [Apiospora phragmitis]|uniref:FAD dependent oxidoreductase-domain-containing protein n=1 Tax=Apiospora phragmitis TaxID=2905665 RepID=A0ABR1VFQ2_9PEZI